MGLALSLVVHFIPPYSSSKHSLSICPRGWGPDHKAGQWSVTGIWGRRAWVGKRGLTIPGTGSHHLVSMWLLPQGPGFEKETGLKGPRQSETQEPESSHPGVAKQSVLQSVIWGQAALASCRTCQKCQVQTNCRPSDFRPTHQKPRTEGPAICVFTKVQVTLIPALI